MLGDVTHQAFLVAAKVAGGDFPSHQCSLGYALIGFSNFTRQPSNAAATGVADEQGVLVLVSQLKYPHMPVTRVKGGGFIIQLNPAGLHNGYAWRSEIAMSRFFFGMMEISIASKCSISISIR